MTTAPIDRRQRRRQETIEEVLDVAAAIMAEQGAAGLSLGEIARRMGIRPPSLYVYFPSKHAVYDALFARGAQSLLDVIQDADRTDLEKLTTFDAFLLGAAGVFVRWSVEHPAYSQLLFWRPVPGFAPSPEAYRPAVELLGLTTQRFADLQHRGLVRRDVPPEQVTRDWTVLSSGVTSQQPSNAPDESFDTGRFVQALPDLVAMFARYYSEPRSTAARGRASRADQR
ncbi:MAG TPA: TetR/AcrR family transcriptional regulator [Actinomycetes bacterium]